MLINLVIFSQADSLFHKKELQLKSYLDQLRAAKNDAEKELANATFKDYLFETIQLEGAFDYPFASLKTIGTIKSPDNTFRLYNWNVEQDDHTNKYFCYILRFDDKKKNWKIIELKDQSSTLPSQPDDFLDEENWYGALYYKIIPVEKSNKTYYTILGWDGSSAITNTKLIDVLTFSGNNHVKLGSPIFKLKDGIHKRLFFEHSKRAFMTLNYDQERKRIIYDHLSPETSNLEGFREFYVPDFTYDELKFSNNKWQLKEDVIGVNVATNKTQKISYANPKKGAKEEIVQKEVKTKWIDPSNPNSPNGGNVHVAQLPEEDKKDAEKVQTASPDLKPKILTKKAKKNEFSMNPFMKGKRK
jgi:hypothetical protein